jgi:hypothetical protein
VSSYTPEIEIRQDTGVMLLELRAPRYTKFFEDCRFVLALMQAFKMTKGKRSELSYFSIV